MSSRASPWPLTTVPDGQVEYPVSPDPSGLDHTQIHHSKQPSRDAVFGATGGLRSPPMSADRSVSPPSDFDATDDQQLEYTLPNQRTTDEPGSYDLKPPPPSVRENNIETLALRFFSKDHLDAILRDANTQARFVRFLKQYLPNHAPTLDRYLETQKAIVAVEYANSVADTIPAQHDRPPYVAAQLDQRFEAKSKRVVEDLIGEALPAYVTNRLTQLVTDSLVKEITGNGAPIMREMIPQLAEVYCVTDPSLPDNPIVYASDEFYNTTQYGREYVIGRNCRFLQGPKTSHATVRRLIDALTEGQEICETILNYRRDGTPFMNLLLIAPLYDNKGNVRYFLGAQIDVSPLIEGGRGLESFSRLLAQDRAESRFGGRAEREPKKVLEDFSSMLSEEETNIVMSRARSMSQASEATTAQRSGVRGKRRVLGFDDPAAERALWPDRALGPSGRLPGVYQNYFLVRPYPSLRITFTSPALRIPGLLQTKFMDRVAGPQNVRDGILDAMQHGTGVTAKISWLTSASGGDSHLSGKPRWIHCTPLLGSDERVGVWMIVMVENEEVTGRLNRGPPQHIPSGNNGNGMGVMDASGLKSPARTCSPSNVGSAYSTSGGPATYQPQRDASHMTGNKLYADYLRRQGKPEQPRGRPRTRGGDGSGDHITESAREQKAVDGEFKDF